MLKILDGVSETLLFNVLDKVGISFGARGNSAPDSELTDQNVWLFTLSLRMNQQTKFQ